jgi:hypothetical protein
MALRRKKSTTQRAADAIGGYVKTVAAGKAAKGAGKAAKGTGKAAKGTAIVVAKRTSWKTRIPMLAGVGLAAFAILKMTHRGGGDPATA